MCHSEGVEGRGYEGQGWELRPGVDKMTFSPASDDGALRNKDQITSKLSGQASCLPGDSRDGYLN